MDLGNYSGLSTSELFWLKVNEDATGCWVWNGAKSGNGYGRVARWDSTTKRRYGQPAHRFAYEDLVTNIPDGLVLDHLCKNILCVNPTHLEPVPQSVNLSRGLSPSALNAVKEMCPQGHPYDGSNLYSHPNGSRRCKACHRDREAKRRALKAAKGVS